MFGVTFMYIKELTDKVRGVSTKRSHEKRVRMLRNAHILDKNGYFSEHYFSQETIKKDKEAGKAITA